MSGRCDESAAFDVRRRCRTAAVLDVAGAAHMVVGDDNAVFADSFWGDA